ncbi:MAG: valine--tRNA ligase [Bacilli bacterium]|nr:valine--tRNA ligase [Bacilli bacterium]
MKEMSKAYSHKECEQGKEEFWEKNHYFEAMREENLSKPPFSMIVPPPNVTGILHIGHATNTTILDIIARYKKLSGYDVLFLPDMDHAGIATQAKVEAKLREEGKNKYEMGREKFLEEAWKWKEEHGDYISRQWRALGLSMDYSKERFTLDEGMCKAVNKVFKKLYDEGLIYRGERIINWDPVLKTALSDIEVVYSQDNGHFYYFKYWFEDHSSYLEVATTRPETMFGDQAVVFNPDDERFNKYEGKKVINPANGELLPLIADRYVDMEFGTGVMKCTPAHDPNDFQIAKRHGLKFVKTMNDDATMNDLVPEEYRGLDRYECRKKVVKAIEANGDLIKIEDIVHNVGHSDRSKAVVEPMLSKQWFVKMKPLSTAVMEMQKSENRTEFFPQRFADIFYQWLDNTDDWCISRQLWWGHRIPVYTNSKTGQVVCSETPMEGEDWVQDNDVLDTWFSSALAPFGFLGWPDENSPLLKRYYPLDVMVTAYDIIFFWVERMAFQGLHFSKVMPFKKVYIHGLVRDAQGRKMSKSLGNGIDPFDVIEKYGTDSLRYALATGGTPGLDINFSFNKVDMAHNFLNKVWNASRYILSTLPTSFTPREIQKEELSYLDQWILSEADSLINSVKTNMEKYELGQAADYVYSFVYDEFCSEYLEYTKVTLQGDDETKKETTLQVLYSILKKILVVLFPFAPFITEEIYSYLPNHKLSIYEEEYPSVTGFEYDKEEVQLALSLRQAIKNIRNHKANTGLAPNAPIDLQFYGSQEKLDVVLPYLTRFSFARSVTKIEKENDDLIYFPSFGIAIVEEETEESKARREKRIEFLRNEIARSEKMLSNPNFLAKANPAKVEAEKQKYESYKAELAKYLK